jgi:hypothetical protein
MIKKLSGNDVLLKLQTIYFLLIKELLSEYAEYIYLCDPIDLSIYILFNMKFMKKYNNYATLAY